MDTQQKQASVRLNEVGPNKVEVIKIVRETLGLDLKEVVDLVDKAPCYIIENSDYQIAKEIVSELSRIGADAVIINPVKKEYDNGVSDKINNFDSDKKTELEEDVNGNIQSFKIFNDRLILNDNRIKVIKLRFFVNKLAEEAKREFLEQYQRMGDMDKLVRKGADIAADILIDKAQKCSEYMVNLSIYSCSPEHLYGMLSTSFFDEAFDSLQDWYIDTISDQEEKENYRKMRKQYRRKWVGMGIGTQAAISADIQASTMNAMSGMAHGVVNAVGNTFTALGTELSKSLKYSDKSTSDALCRGIYLDVYCLNFAMQCELLGEIDDWDAVDPVEEKDAEAIFNNLQNYINKNGIDEKANEIAYSLFEKDPNQREYYEYCISKFKRDNMQLIALAEMVGFDMYNEKEKILSDFLDMSDHSTEEKAVELQAQIIEKEQQMGIHGSKALDKIQAILKDFDIKARTFQDILFDTREEKKQAESDYVILTTKYDFDYIENASEQVCEVMKADICSGNYISQIKDIFVNKIDERINKIWTYEDRFELNKLFLNTDVTNPDAIVFTMQQINSVGRTSDKLRFIHALKQFIPNNIKKIRKGFKAENQNMFLRVIIAIIGSIFVALGVILLIAEMIWTSIVLIVIGVLVLTRRKRAIKKKYKIWNELTLDNSLVHPYLESIRCQYKKG